MKRLKLFLSACALMISAFANAQTDVTSDYITNADFSSTTPINSNLKGYGKDGTPYGFQSVDGWTSVVISGDNSNGSYPNSGMGAAVFAYGSSYQLQGNNKAAPASGPNGGSGNCLGFFGVWGCGGYYYQEVTLQPGAYTINIPVYNQSGTNSTTTYFGWTPDEGTASTIATPTSTGSWTTLTTSFTLTEATKGQIRVGYKSNGNGSGANPHLFIDKVQILCSPFANSSDYEALNTAISAVEGKTWGFDAGEYAPYNYVEVIQALAAAQAIDQNANNSQASVQALTATLNTSMTANAAEVNAIWDPSFEHDYSGQTGNVQPIGWYREKNNYTGDGYNVRYMDLPSGTNTSGHGVFGKFTLMYGEEPGYTLPLNEAYYTLSFIYGGWNEVGTREIRLYNDDNNAEVFTNTVTAKNDQAHTTSSAYSTYNGFIKVPAAGNYVLSFYRQSTNAQNQIVLSDFVLKTTTLAEATTYYNNVKTSVESDYDASANGGAEKTAFKNALDADVSGMTVAEIMEAAAALPGLRDAFVNAVSTFDALAAEIVKAGNLGVDAAIIAANTATSSTTAAEAKTFTQNLKVAEYTYVTTKYDTDGSALFIADWDVTNFDALDAQHWSGATRTYYDKWSGSSFNCSISKTVTLPEGHYAFYAAGRGQANSASAVTLKVAISGGSTLTQSYTMKGDTGKGIDTSGAANFGEGTFANGNAGRGWEWRYIAFDLAAETEVTLSIEGAGNNSWVSACDTKLLTYENVEVSRRLYVANKTTAETARDNDTYTNVNGAERAALLSAIGATPETTYSGYLSAANALETATNAFIAAKTNWDALVREIGKATALGASTTTAESVRDNAATTSADALAATQALKVVEYNYVTSTYGHGVDLGTWTKTGSTGSLNSQHWSGETREYLEQSSANWAAGSWTIKYAQDLTLPAGNYVFKVAGRQADSDGVTLSLTVKNGDTVLGSVSDFPRGDRGLGITTAGATSFDPNDTFCNTRNNNGDNLQTNGGNGWEWRYVKFTLDDEATVNVAVDAVATIEHMWVSFCDATVQTDNEANISLIAYNIALNDATTARDNSEYTNVTGDEKTTLLAAIAADESLDKTDKDAIDAATTALNNATSAFIAAKSAYDAFVAAKAVEYENNLPYASSTKYAAIATAQAATATSASDATTKTNAIISAYRQYVESNAMAEGVAGAEDKTFLISDPNMDVTYDGTNHTFGAWQVFNQVDGTISLKTESDEPLTDGNGNKYKYADIWKADNNGGIKQTLENLPAGKYLLTVAGRAQDADGATFGVFAGSYRTEINRIGASGGVFDRGWNDASVEFYVTETSDVEIGVQSGNGKTMWWGATRFRLVKLPTPEVTISENATSAPDAQALADITLTRTLSADYWNTFSVPFNAAKPDGWTVKEFDSNDGNIINFKNAESIVAGKPYLVKPTANVENPTFNGVTVQNIEGSTDGEGDYQFAAQIYNKSLATQIENGTIAYLSTASDDDGQIIKKLTSGGIKGLRAYFIVPASGVGARIHFMEENETTGIESIDNGQLIMDNGAAYDLQGRKVQNPKRGMYIINGKKVIVK